MRKFFISTMLLLMTTSLFCQTGISQPLTQQDYLQKSKKQKTAAWVLLGGGLAVAVGSALLDVNSDWSKEGTGYTIAFFTGVASMLASIPLFIASGRNKRKAMNASAYFKIRQNHVPTNKGLTLHSIPTLSLKFNF